MLQNAHVFSGYSVKDIDEAKAFYEGVLGLTVEVTPEGLSLHLKSNYNVFLYAKNDHTPATFTVLNFLVDDIDITIDTLTSKGVIFEIYDTDNLKTDEKGVLRGDRGPKAIAWFKDPSGNILSVIQEK